MRSMIWSIQSMFVLMEAKAIRTTNLTTGISSSLSGIAYIMQFMISVVWSMLFFVLMLSFTLMVSERKKEFAILRAMGVSRNGLVLTVLKEILLIGLAGGVIGVVLGFIVIVPFWRNDGGED